MRGTAMRFVSIGRPGALTVLLGIALYPANSSFAQDQAAQERPAAKDKAGAQDKPKESGVPSKVGSKQAVEARLKAAEKPKPTTPIDDVERTLFATHRIEQAA